jgi:hypothetical protein
MIERDPTDDERAGIEWWNALDKRQRAYWVELAGNAGRAEDAWTNYKREQALLTTMHNSLPKPGAESNG